MVAQNAMEINATVKVESKTIIVEQTIVYKNESNTVLKDIYLNDWNNSYSTKSTPLAKRFEEEFSTKFHLAKSEQRGFTVITSIKNENNTPLQHQRLKDHIDVIKVTLETPLQPNASYSIKLNYQLLIPDATFTGYGFSKTNDFDLKYWYITPAVYDGQWQYYSNKNLDDLFVPKSDIILRITHPRNYKVSSELDFNAANSNNEDKTQTTILSGKDRIDTYLSLKKLPKYNFVQTDDFILISNISEKGLQGPAKALLTDRVTRYLTKHLGTYPHKQLLVSSIDYQKNPLYGLNQLPAFFRPFPNDFQYELKLVKTALKKYIDNILLLNPRKEHWLSEGLQIYYLIKYVEEYYPDMKLIGTLADIWGIKAFHAADLKFNFQYFLYSMEVARKNIDQPLTTSKDSLTKFNANIAVKYKAGVGLNYLDQFTEDIELPQLITEFLQDNQLKSITISDFESYITSKTKKDIRWFFTDYVNTRKKIDFKIKSIKTIGDSLQLTIKNKRDNAMPISLYKLQNDSVTDHLWMENIKGTKTIMLPKDNTEKFSLDYDNVIPEFNQRDNFKAIKGSFLKDKPLQIRLLKDFEDPNYNQIFFMPLVEFNNIYDGLTLGSKMYNKTMLRKRLNYRISPQYATKSRALTGSTSVYYTHNIENKKLYDITYGLAASYESFASDAFFTRIRPSLSFNFRDDSDFRSNQRDQIMARYVSIKRELGKDATVLIDEPDYGVFNLRYTHSNPGIINYSKFNTDLQIADKFSKISFNYEFRELTKNNRNINFRFFAGYFLENIAEGGFKSKLDTPFANQWMTTANFSTSIWRYIQFYGDVGLVKNKYQNAKFLYDSGIRLNLVEDYFEIYFPMYSNLGWEVGEQNYDQRIRFMFTVDPNVLLGLFRRKWY